MAQVVVPLRQQGLHHGDFTAALAVVLLGFHQGVYSLPSHGGDHAHDGQRHHDFNQGKAAMGFMHHGGPSTLERVMICASSAFFTAASRRTILGLGVPLTVTATV